MSISAILTAKAKGIAEKGRTFDVFYEKVLTQVTWQVGLHCLPLVSCHILRAFVSFSISFSVFAGIMIK